MPNSPVPSTDTPLSNTGNSHSDSFTFHKQAFLFRMFAMVFIAVALWITYVYFLPNSRFDHFAKQFFVDELCQNPLTFHFAIQNNDSLSIDEKKLALPVYKAKSALSSGKEIYSLLDDLHKIPVNRLSQNNQVLYCQLEETLTLASELSAYPYFADPCSPDSGVPSQLPLLLAEYRFDDKTDVDCYLQILAQLPDYYDGLTLYEQEKAANGLFMSDTAADKIIRQCSDLMGKGSLSQSHHFLKETFSDKLQNLIISGQLTAEEKKSYEMEHDRLLTTVVAPTYEKLADNLTLLKGNINGAPSVSHGLAYYTGGKEYYKLLLRQETGSNRSIEDIKVLLLNDLKTNYELLVKLMRKNPTLQQLFLKDTNFLPAMSPEEILSANASLLKDRYPDADTVSCEIKEVNSSMQPYTAPAFFMIPPIDNLSENTIYLNPQDTSAPLELFTTLAHEGYPGHLYQNLYVHNYWKEAHISPLKSVLNYEGFVEGWAIYTELDSYRTAATVACQIPSAEKSTENLADNTADNANQPLSFTTDAKTIEQYYLACRLNRQIQLAFYCLLDIAIHYEGILQNNVEQLLSLIGIHDHAAITALYDYIVEEPCNYLKYYLGYLEIMELKKQAAKQWNYTKPVTIACDAVFDYRFHCFLLQNGPNSFATLSQLLSEESSVITAEELD